MQIGIVGKPNTGKSTLFNAITEKEIEAANYPFTTIEPNKGVAFASTECPCRELDVTCDPNNSHCIEGTRYVPINVLDIAGLVPGASEGKGMGNEFLDSIREANALIHVIDAAGNTNKEGEPSENYNPVKDVEFIEEEFTEWMFNLFTENWKSNVKKFRTQDNKLDEFLAKRFSGLGITKQQVRKVLRKVELPEKLREWEDEKIHDFVERLRKESKPMIFAANKADLPGAEENIDRLREAFPEKTFVPTSAAAELSLRNAAEKGKIQYNPGDSDFEAVEELSEKQENGLEKIRENVLEKYGSTGIQELVNRAVFDLLDMIVVYPVEDTTKYSDQKGNVLPDAVLVEKGATPPELAYTIHSDIGDSYTKAVDAKTGRSLGKNYELEEGDIVKIFTN
ncbi:MAG: redox-regulated ATPase YchF [Candidatus Nanohaloarchaeota archaeon QJJ-9]|nr:redox-regulated ATPase YchF [Candidatus Nanohaloarchaeota archaeon QJJ-9]